MSFMCKQCWTTHITLEIGIIISTRKNPDYYIVRYKTGEEVPMTPRYVHHSPQQALDACEENARYWAAQVDNLKEEIIEEEHENALRSIAREFQK